MLRSCRAGLAHKRLGQIEPALDAFHKLNAIIPDTPEVVSQLAQLYDRAGDVPQALEWLQMLISISPTDPDALSRAAELFDKDGDKSQAYQHMLEVP